MKKWLFLIGLVALFLRGALDVHAAGGTLFKNVEKDVKVTIKSIDAPNYSASDATSPGKISWQNQWLMIKVEFKPSKSEKEELAWRDGIKMNVEVLFQYKKKAGGYGWCLFTGTSEFWTIHRDGREHVAAMFIPPQILDRYLQKHTKTFVKVQFDSEEPVYDEKKSDEAFKAVKAATGVTTVSGAVLPRNLTPWAVVNADKYDLLKPAGVALGTE